MVKRLSFRTSLAVGRYVTLTRIAFSNMFCFQLYNVNTNEEDMHPDTNFDSQNFMAF